MSRSTRRRCRSAPGSSRICGLSRPTLHDPRDGGAAERYLHTSPEFAMKKLLVAGLPRIWQLAHVFRDGERSATHHPEFAMLEWYRVGASYRDLMDECEALVRACQDAAGAEALVWRGGTADARLPWRRLSVAAAFSELCGIDLLATAPDPLRTRCRTPRRRGAPDRGGAACGRRLGDALLPHFPRADRARSRPRAPTILYDYPLSMAALARRSPGDPRLAERFEVYVCGLELANAFGELTDAAEQRAGSPPTRRESRRSTARPTRSTRISSPPSSTACRNAPGSHSASIAW